MKQTKFNKKYICHDGSYILYINMTLQLLFFFWNVKEYFIKNAITINLIELQESRYKNTEHCQIGNNKQI